MRPAPSLDFGSVLVFCFVSVILIAAVVVNTNSMPSFASAATVKTVARFAMKTCNKSSNNNPLVVLAIARGSVVHFSSPLPNAAIVNAANEGCLGGGGVDGAISDAGGINLYKDRLALPIVLTDNSDEDEDSDDYGNNYSKEVRCPTGTAVVTGPSDDYGTLHVNHVIHAVGPNYWYFEGFDEPDRLLKSAYQSSLTCGREAGIQSVAFSLLSAGVFRGKRSVKDVLKIGIMGIRDWIQEQEDPGSLEMVTLCGFSEKETDVLLSICEEEFEERIEEEGDDDEKDGEESETLDAHAKSEDDEVVVKDDDKQEDSETEEKDGDTETPEADNGDTKNEEGAKAGTKIEKEDAESEGNDEGKAQRPEL